MTSASIKLAIDEHEKYCPLKDEVKEKLSWGLFKYIFGGTLVLIGFFMTILFTSIDSRLTTIDKKIDTIALIKTQQPLQQKTALAETKNIVTKTD